MDCLPFQTDLDGEAVKVEIAAAEFGAGAGTEEAAVSPNLADKTGFHPKQALGNAIGRNIDDIAVVPDQAALELSDWNDFGPAFR